MFSKLLPILFLAFSAVNSVNTQPASDDSTLYINAIVGKGNVSTLECWGLIPGFTVSHQVRHISFCIKLIPDEFLERDYR